LNWLASLLRENVDQNQSFLQNFCTLASYHTDTKINGNEENEGSGIQPFAA
jgi:hypothetical protein